MSDLVSGDRSRLRAAHSFLHENDRLYRVSERIALAALTIALLAGLATVLWPAPMSLPPPAVPAPAPLPAPAPEAARPAPSAADCDALAASREDVTRPGGVVGVPIE